MEPTLAFAKYNDNLIRHARRFLLPLTDGAEDCCQELWLAYVKFWQRGGVNEELPIWGLLFLMLRQACYRYRRKRQPTVSLDLGEAETWFVVEDRYLLEDLALLKAAIEQLPRSQRLAILAMLAEIPDQQAALVGGVAYPTMRQHRRYAIVKLRRALGLQLTEGRPE